MNSRQVSTYNANGWLTTQDSFNSTYQTSHLAYTYDAVGNTTQYVLTAYNSNGSVSYTNTYNYSYLKFDNYKQSSISATSTFFQPGTTSFSYDANGGLTSVTDSGNSNNNRTFVVNTQGLTLQKSQVGKTEYYYYANGNPIGSNGDIGGTNANFDYNYTPVSDQYPATSPSTYVVGQGDTLQSIALAVYGDAKLWYFIADANGLRSDSDLKVGQTLTVPNKISNLHNDSTTHKVYVPGEIIGDTTPTLPDPPPPPPPPQPHGKHGCGGFAMIAVIIVSVVAAVVTAGALAPLMGVAVPGATTLVGTSIGVLTGAAGFTAAAVATAAIAGAVGSVASQLTGMALGVQSKFSWGAVAIGALGAGVTAGLGSVANGAGVGSLLFEKGGMAAAAVNAVAGNVVNQGINILVGQQKSFDWSSVAFAGISAAATNYLGKTQFGKDLGIGQDPQAARSFSFGNVATQTLSGIAKGAVVQAFSHHGKIDWENVGADAFGNALANSIVGALRNPSATSAPAAPAPGPASAMEPTADAGAPIPYAPSGADDAPDASGNGGPATYAVVRGDTLWSIAKAQLPAGASNMDVQNQVYALMQANGISDPRALRAGDSLTLAVPGEGDIDPATVAAYQKSDADLQAYRAEQEAARMSAGAQLVSTASPTLTLDGTSGSQATGAFNLFPGIGLGISNFDPAWIPDDRVLFGQKRMSPEFGPKYDRFGNDTGRPDYLAGRDYRDVAADLVDGKLSPNDIPIEAFEHEGRLVSANTRSLATLAEAGMRPTNVTIVEPGPDIVARLGENPILPDASLPATKVPVTSDGEVIDIVELPPSTGARLGAVASGVGKAVTVAGAAIDAYSLGTEINKSVETGEWSNTAREAVRIGGGWTGAWAGAEGGAAAGATIGGGIGTFVGFVGAVPGAAIGGFVGGIVGGVAGYWGGSKAATTAYDAIQKR